MKLRLHVLLFVLYADSVNAGSLITMANAGAGFMVALIRVVNLGALLIGLWWVMDGVMNWKKSARDDTNNIGFKQIVIPIISGVILSSFAGFVALTSETFGLKGSYF